MKPTWTKVYKAPGYPVDPARELERALREPITYRCEMEPCSFWYTPSRRPTDDYYRYLNSVLLAESRRDWKESWIDEMAIIDKLQGKAKVERLSNFKRVMALLPKLEQLQLKEALRQRFTPSNGQDGCQSATAAVKDVTST